MIAADFPSLARLACVEEGFRNLVIDVVTGIMMVSPFSD
jgi:hypothetical protein